MNWTQQDIDNFEQRKKGPTPKATTPLQKMQALGRMKAGKMNKTENAYMKVLEMEKRTGAIINYWFEPMNLRIGDNCFYKTDFLVLNKHSELELREVKGFMQDDALVKLKAIAKMYPFRVIVIKLVKGEWVEREF